MSDQTPSGSPEQETPATDQYPSAPAPSAEAAAAPSAPLPPRPPLPHGSAFHTQPTQPLPPAQGGPAPTGQSYASAPAATITAPQPAAPATTDAASASARIGAGKVLGLIVAAALVGGAAGLGASAAGASLFGAAGSTVVTAGPSTVTVNDTTSVNQTTAIAAKATPSVVTISASSGSSGGTGSGVILTSDGYVVTNTHVVTLDGATGSADITVTDSTGKVYQAEVVGTDPTYDLAVIKLTGAEGLTPITFADSSQLNVGDQTVAIGAPLGLSNTVTTGIVSALNRSIQIASSAAPEGQDEDQQSEGDSPFQFDFGQGQQQQSTSTGTISIAVIQTDAAINPGNSGGALVDDEGRLIGINVAIATASSSSSESGSIGVGFSIPSNVVQRITDEIIESGEATHGLLGAMVGDAASQDGATTTGAYISEVTTGGAAEAAGLKAGDVVTSFNGYPVTDATDLTAQVRALGAGDDATVVYIRDGETKSVDVTLGELTQ